MSTRTMSTTAGDGGDILPPDEVMDPPSGPIPPDHVLDPEPPLPDPGPGVPNPLPEPGPAVPNPLPDPSPGAPPGPVTPEEPIPMPLVDGLSPA